MPLDYLTKESSEVREAFAQLEQIERTLKETEKHMCLRSDKNVI